MRNKRFLFALLLCLAMAFSSVAVASEIMPFCNSNARCAPLLVISENNANCKLDVYAENCKKEKIIMKKDVCIPTLFLALCLVMAVPTFAADEVTNEPLENTTVEVNGYSFDIQEKVDENFTIVRTYVNPDAQLMIINDDVDKAKALLIALGMDEEGLELWTDESILAFANSEKATISLACYKLNEEDDTLIQIPKEVSDREVAAVLAIQEQLNNDITPYVGNTEISAYIDVYHGAAYQGNTMYTFSTNAHWKTMPRDRGYDSISCASQSTNLDSHTIYGSWSYNQTTVTDGDVKKETIRGTKFVENRIIPFSDGSGVAGIFKLPTDMSGGDGLSIKYDNFNVHYEYKGGIIDYTSPKNFSSVGTYSHATRKLTAVPSLSAGLSSSGPNAGLSIGLASEWNPQNYTSAIIERYIPPTK